MIRPPTPPRAVALLLDQARAEGRLLTILEASMDSNPGGKYLPWDKVRRRTPPEGLTPEEWWLGIKIARKPLRRALPLVDLLRRPFTYGIPDPVTERLQRIDRDASGQILLSEEAVSPAHRDRYVVSSLMEESIMSSLLEGAATTRREAKEMLRVERKPTTPGERMVMNNFLGMHHVRDRLGEPLSIELICELHEVLTRDTADAGVPGSFRGPDHDDRFGVWSGDRRLYTPPPHEQVPALIEQVCAFANAADGPFVHPVIKAIAIHFWIGYVHPFDDGNGRTARALFYWYLLRQKYWLFEYVSISSVLKEAYAEYARAYLYTETDENDLTYFLLFQLNVIDRALDEVHAYIRRKSREMRETRAVLSPSADINHRQIALLRHALQHPEAVYTFSSHQHSHGVVYQTARTDLIGLAEQGLLREDADSSSRTRRFYVPQDLSERVREAP